MGGVISFEERAVASLRARLGAAESANQDLIAFARGHSGAVASIHQAVLELMAADDLETVLATATREWPLLLGIDVAAIALVIGDQGFLADSDGIGRVEPAIVSRTSERLDAVAMRSVQRGHALFGKAADAIRAEAIVRFESGPGLPHGLLLLGQVQDARIDGSHGATLLQFLGQSLGAILRRWIGTKTR